MVETQVTHSAGVRAHFDQRRSSQLRALGDERSTDTVSMTVSVLCFRAVCARAERRRLGTPNRSRGWKPSSPDRKAALCAHSC